MSSKATQLRVNSLNQVKAQAKELTLARLAASGITPKPKKAKAAPVQQAPVPAPVQQKIN